MKIKTFFLSLLLSVYLSSPIWAATINTDCTSAANVNTALNNASSDDTVLCTGNGWSSGTVTLPNTKNITLDGNGATISGSAGLNLPSSANYTGRVTRFTITANHVGAVSTFGKWTDKPWRFDHITVTGVSVAFMETGAGPGLIDHMTAVNMPAYIQMIETRNITNDNYTDSTPWQNALTPGSPAAIYIEDSTFANPSGDIWGGACVFQGYYGARLVVRKSTLNAVMLEAHGNPGWVGTRWWEYYDNKGTNYAFCSRAGSGLMFDNTGTEAFIMLGEEDSGYPAPYQIGMGQGGTSSFPAYVWNNPVTPDLNTSGLCANVQSGMVQLNRDVFYPSGGTTLPATCTVGQGYWKTDAGGHWDATSGNANNGALYKCTATNTWTLYYVPYTYPHPLQSGTTGGGATAPAAPTGLSIR
jgi:hypothetical protein